MRSTRSAGSSVTTLGKKIFFLPEVAPVVVAAARGSPSIEYRTVSSCHLVVAKSRRSNVSREPLSPPPPARGTRARTAANTMWPTRAEKSMRLHSAQAAASEAALREGAAPRR